MFSFHLKRRVRGWSKRVGVVCVLMSLVAVLLSGCGGSSAPYGGVCVTDPSNTAPGAGGSLYVLDARGISHYSAAGKLLTRLRSQQDDFAVDRAGNAYFSRGNDIMKVSGNGAVLARFPAPGYQPEAVDTRGTIFAVQGGSLAASDSYATVERISRSGRVLSRWATPYASTLVVGADGSLYGNGGLNAGGDLAKIDPLTGKTLTLFHRALGASFDALAASPQGAIYVGVVDSADAPFAVQKMSHAGGRYTFKTLNSAQESVGGLSVARDGSIFVIRASYDEPGGGTGLEELSPTGSSEGKFKFCSPAPQS